MAVFFCFMYRALQSGREFTWGHSMVGSRSG